MVIIHGIETFEIVSIIVVLIISIISLVYAFVLAKGVLSAKKGTEVMVRVWSHIRDGSNAYLYTQFRSIVFVMVGLTVFMFLSVFLAPPTGEANEMFCPLAVEEKYVEEISLRTALEAQQVATIIKEGVISAQKLAIENGFPTFNPERVASYVSCRPAMWWIAIGRTIAFIMGAAFSTIVGFVGMNIAVQANVRVAHAAKSSFKEAMNLAYRSGTVTGMLTDGLGLLGGTLIFIIFGKASPEVLLGFGFGGTLIAFFMRVGGGVYTKAADVGADLVGKIEMGLDEDDPRNAAVVADLVGDNVGDCAGMAADIFESYEVTIVSSLILGLNLASSTGHLFWIILPLLVRGVGVVSSIVGTLTISMWKNVDTAEEAMFKSYELSSAITIASTFLLAVFYSGAQENGMLISHLSLGALVSVGVGLAVAFNPLTAWATSDGSSQVKSIARSTAYGPALVILEGLSLGYISSVYSVILIVLGILASILVYTVEYPTYLYFPTIVVCVMGAVALVIYAVEKKKDVMNYVFYAMWVLVGGLFLISMQAEGVEAGDPFTYILFGVSLIGVGMLSHTGNNVSMDTFGPIADNAEGISELSGEGEFSEEAKKILTSLDASGNTTKAITKGVAIGSAVIAAVSLFGSFFTDMERAMSESRLRDYSRVVNLANPTVFVGLLIGGCLPMLFAGLMIKAVRRAAGHIMAEVRNQLKNPKVMDRSQSPDYASVVTIATKAAQSELVPLGLLAVLSPIVVGFLLKEQALGGFLAGVILSGQLQAVFMANAGGAWDNAKKHVEDGNFGGKGSENHKAAVVGDTVGDPLKDTAGPALNPLVKVLNLVSLIISPIIVSMEEYNMVFVICSFVLLGVIAWVVIVKTNAEGRFDPLKFVGNAAKSVKKVVSKNTERN